MKKKEKLEIVLVGKDRYPEWDEAVLNSPQNNLFSLTKWLSLYPEDSFEIVGIVSDFKIIGGVVLPLKGTGLLRTKINTPILPKILQTDKVASLIEMEKRFLEPLAEYVKGRNIRYHGNWHISMTNWLPFYWQGFQQTTRYTYILDDLSNHEKLWDGFQTKIRGDIRKAESKGILVEEGTAEDHIRLASLSHKISTEESALIRFAAQTLTTDQTLKVFVAKNQNGEILCSAVFLSDESTAYYWLAAHAKNMNLEGAPSYLIWSFLKSQQQLKQFNFLGSVIPDVEKYFRGFGGKLIPYLSVSSKSRSSLFSRLKRFFKRLFK